MLARALTAEDEERLIFYERFFFDMDPDANGYVEAAEMRIALSYTSLSQTSAHIDKRITSADRMDTRRDDGKKETPGYTAGRDHRLVRMEFIELCIDVLWDVPFEQLRAAVANHQAAVKAVRRDGCGAVHRKLSGTAASRRQRRTSSHTLSSRSACRAHRPARCDL